MTAARAEPATIAIVRTVAALRDVVAGWRREGETIALVPTMGALHEGHLSLIDVARAHADRVVVSIFVNPAQFGAGEDIAHYPREESADLEKLAARSTDLVYAPSAGEMYPDDFSTTVAISEEKTRLSAVFRPGHIEGVTTIVSKLFMQCTPDVAVFGEKDYQQLLNIRQLVTDLNIPVEVIGGATIRDPQGLALSSRNAYLSADELRTAARLNQILAAAAGRLEAGSGFAGEIDNGLAALRDGGFDCIDYLEVCDAETLAPVDRTVV